MIVFALLFAMSSFAQNKAIEYREAGRTRVVLESALKTGGILPISNLIFYYNCSESDTLINEEYLDSKPFSDGGTGISASFANGYLGAGIGFDANQDSLFRADTDITETTGSFTINTLFKHGDVATAHDTLFKVQNPADSVGWLVIFSYTDSLLYFLITDTVGVGEGDADTDTVTSTTATTLYDDEWHFIAIERDTTGATNYIRIYVDSVMSSTAITAATLSLLSGTPNFVIGQSLDGELDEIMYWSTALSEAQLEYLKQIAILHSEEDNVFATAFDDSLNNDHTITGDNIFTGATDINGNLTIHKKVTQDSIDLVAETKPFDLLNFADFVSYPDWQPDLKDTIQVTADWDTIDTGLFPIMKANATDSTSATHDGNYNELQTIQVLYQAKVPAWFIGIDSLTFDYQTTAGLDSANIKIDVVEYNAVTGAGTFQDSTTTLASLNTWTHDKTLSSFSKITRYDSFMIRIRFRSIHDGAYVLLARIKVFWKEGS